MRLHKADLIGSLVFAAIAVPYVGYLVNGSMPFIEDPRGMSAVGIVLGTLGFVLMHDVKGKGRASTVEGSAAAVSMGLGLVTFILAETAAAPALLAVFMTSILGVWVLELVDHAGLWPGTNRPSGASHA